MNHEPRIANARRLVVKVGSSLIMGGSDGPRSAWLASLADDVLALRHAGKEVLLVSSGAVALGRSKLGLKRSPRLDHKQAAAAAADPRGVRRSRHQSPVTGTGSPAGRGNRSSAPRPPSER